MIALPRWAPRGLREALASHGAMVDRAWEEPPRGYLCAVGGDGPLFARASVDPRDAAVFAHEAEVRRLIGTEGALRAPAVLASGSDWMLEAAILARPLAGPSAIDAAVAAAAALAGRTALLERPAPRASREGRRARLLRRGRALARGVPPRDVLAARRARTSPRLPPVVSHGDFHAGNLLWDGSALWVVDWEGLGLRPAGFDLMALWPTLADAADRDHVFEAAAGLLGAAQRPALAALRHASVVAVAMGKLAPDRPFNGDPDGGRALVRLLPELRCPTDR